jgi:hypothetical protein
VTRGKARKRGGGRQNEPDIGIFTWKREGKYKGMLEKKGGEAGGKGGGGAATVPLRAPKGRVVAHMRLEESVRGKIRQRGKETSGGSKGEVGALFEPIGEARGSRGSPPAPKERVFRRRGANLGSLYVFRVIAYSDAFAGQV